MFEVSLTDELGKGKLTFEMASHKNSSSVIVRIPLGDAYGLKGKEIKWFVEREALIKAVTSLK